LLAVAAIDVEAVTAKTSVTTAAIRFIHTRFAGCTRGALGSTAIDIRFACIKFRVVASSIVATQVQARAARAILVIEARPTIGARHAAAATIDVGFVTIKALVVAIGCVTDLV
jgi:hypothetical protein